MLHPIMHVFGAFVKDYRGDISKMWSMADGSPGPRTVEKIEEWAKTNQLSSKHTPLFGFIPLNHVVYKTFFSSFIVPASQSKQ